MIFIKEKIKILNQKYLLFLDFTKKFYYFKLSNGDYAN